VEDAPVALSPPTEQEAAAVTLQKVSRGRRSRRDVKVEDAPVAPSPPTEQEAAAVTLQKVSRGRRSRRDVKVKNAPPAPPPPTEDEYITEDRYVRYRQRLTYREYVDTVWSHEQTLLSPPPSPPDVAASEAAPTVGKRIVRPNPFLTKLAMKATAQSSDGPTASTTPVASTDVASAKAGAKLKAAKSTATAFKAGSSSGSATALQSAAPSLPASCKPALASAPDAAPHKRKASVTFATAAEANKPMSTPVKGVRVPTVDADADPATTKANPWNLIAKAAPTADAPAAKSKSNSDDDDDTNGPTQVPVWATFKKPESDGEKRDGARFLNALKAAGGGDSDAEGGRKGKMWEKVRAIQAIKRAQISAEEAERQRRSKLVPFSHKYVMFRWITCWTINLTVFIILWLGNYTFGATFGVDVMESILIAWAAGLFQTFIIVEPAEVLGLVLLPSLAECSCIAKCRNDLKEYGFI